MLFTNILLQVETIAETNPLEAIFKYGNEASVVVILMLVVYILGKHFLDTKKDAKENEKFLENRIVTLEQQKIDLQKEHIASVEKHNEKLVIIIRENNAHHEKMLKEYINELEKFRTAAATEHKEQRLFYEQIYTKLETKKG